VEAASEQVAALARVAAKAAERGGVLWVVTRDAQQTTARPEPGSLVGGALWSLGRVLHNEMPRLSMHLLDCPASDPPTERARYLAAELAAPTDGDEIVWTPQGRHVLRVRRGLPPRWANESDVVTLRGQYPGGLDSLGWEIGSHLSVGANQVEIEVHAAGLNF